MALLFCSQDARAANPASDNGSLYQNPWGQIIPKTRRTQGLLPGFLTCITRRQIRQIHSSSMGQEALGASMCQLILAVWLVMMQPGEVLRATEICIQDKRTQRPCFLPRQGPIARQRHQPKALTSSPKTPTCQAITTVLVTRF